MSWDETTIGEALVFNYGKSLPDRDRKGGEVTVYGSGGVVGLHNTALVAGPGIVIGRKGTIGATHWAPIDFFPIDTTYFITPKRADVDLRYAYYLLKSLPLASMNSDAAVPGLNRENAYRLKIRLPKLETQQRIAAILSAYDDLIENNGRRVALLEAAARQLYKEWFVRFRFPGHEHVKIIDGVPDGWERMPASSAMSINPTTRRLGNGEIRLVPMAALSEQSMCCDEKAFEYRASSTSVRFINGDTLFARITPCLENGKTAYANFLADGEVACGSTEFVVLRESRISRFVIYLLAREESFRGNAIQSMIGSSGRQRVQPSCFDKYLVCVPPGAVAESFDTEVQPIFETIRLLDRQSQQLANARDLLLPRLMSGSLAA